MTENAVNVFEFDNDEELNKMYADGKVGKLTQSNPILKNANLVAWAAFYGAVKCFDFLVKKGEKITSCNDVS